MDRHDVFSVRDESHMLKVVDLFLQQLEVQCVWHVSKHCSWLSSFICAHQQTHVLYCSTLLKHQGAQWQNILGKKHKLNKCYYKHGCQSSPRRWGRVVFDHQKEVTPDKLLVMWPTLCSLRCPLSQTEGALPQAHHKRHHHIAPWYKQGVTGTWTKL